MSGGGNTSSTEERNLPPTRKKLADARSKGKIATSRAFVSSVGTVVGLEYVVIRGGAVTKLVDMLMIDASAMSTLPFREAYPVMFSHAMWGAAGFLLPLLLLVTFAVFVAAVVSNGGVIFTFSPLAPNLERIDPMAGIERIFSHKNLINTLETVGKFLAIAIGALVILRMSTKTLAELPICGVGCLPDFTHHFFGALASYVMVLFIAIGVLDIVLQRFVFWREMHMTRTERKKEKKESEGNGLGKKARKQLQQSSMISNVRMGLQNAAFVIYGDDIAVAMAYSAANSPVPTMVARAMGEDDTTLLITEARGLGVPCIANSATAMAVSSKIQLGDTITKPLFAPVITCMKQLGLL